MNKILENMLARSKSCNLKVNDGVFVRVNPTYHTELFTKKDTEPSGKFEKFLLDNLGQYLFNQYAFGKIDDELEKEIYYLKNKYYPSSSYRNGRAKFIS
jgi:hypothetical protein